MRAKRARCSASTSSRVCAASVAENCGGGVGFSGPCIHSRGVAENCGAAKARLGPAAKARARRLSRWISLKPGAGPVDIDAPQHSIHLNARRSA